MATSKVQKTHPNVEKMVLEAIEFHAEKKGSSVQAIKKYISTNFPVNLQALAPHLKKFLHTSVENGVLKQTTGKGMTGRFKIIPEKTAKVKPTEVQTKAKEKPMKTTKEPIKVRVPKAKTEKAPNLVTKSPMLPKARKSLNRPPQVYKAKADKTKKPEQTVVIEKPTKATTKTRRSSTPKVVKNSKKVAKDARTNTSDVPSTSTPHKPPKRKNTTRATVSTKAVKKTPRGKVSSRSTKSSPRIIAIPEVSEESAVDNAPADLFQSPIQRESSESDGSGSSDETVVSSHSGVANTTTEAFNRRKGMRSYYE